MSAAERVAVMEGELDGIDLVEILQVVGIGRQYTGVELLRADHGILGTLFIKSGKVVSAFAGDARGKEAFFQLFQQVTQEARKFFHVFRMQTPAELPEPIGSLGSLLMEALERSHAQEAAAPVKSTASGVMARPFPSEVSLKKPEPVEASAAEAAAPASRPPTPPSSRRRTTHSPAHGTAAAAPPESKAVHPRAAAAPANDIRARKEGPASSSGSSRGGWARLEQPKSSGSGQYARHDGRPRVVLAIASPKGGAGKTTISLNLSLSLARQDRSVILVDGDINGDVLSSIQARERAEYGALDVLARKAHPSQALLKTMLPNFRIMPALGKDLPDPAWLHLDHGAEWQKLLSHLADEAELVIVDCPAGMFGPTRDIATGCTHLLGVLQAELIASRSFSMFNRALTSLPDAQRPEVVGVVLNMLQSRHTGSVHVLQDACSDLPKAWLFDTTIPRSDAFLTATEEGLPLRLLDEKNPPAVSWLFDTLATELSDRLRLAVPERKPRQFLL